MINNITVGAHRLTHPEHDITVEPFGQNWGDKLGGAVGNNPGYNTGFPQVTFRMITTTAGTVPNCGMSTTPSTALTKA